jgi:hypothetical protein
VAVRLFITCWLVYALHFATNTVREIYPALSLGDRLSFDVSEYAGLHPDIFEMPGRGTFINNNPGASILGAIPYAVARPAIDRAVEWVQAKRTASATPAPEYNSIYPLAREFFARSYERGFDVKFALGAGVMQAFLMAPIAALGVVVMFILLYSRTLSVRSAALLALLYGFATPIFFRTGQLNHNVLIAHFALFAFALLWRPWDDASRPGRPAFLLAGLLAGWTVVLDYSGVVVLAALTLYALVRWRSLPAPARGYADLAKYAVGVSLSGAVLLAYQWLAFGNPLTPAQRYMPPTPYSGYGVNGMGWPQLDLFWETTFGLQFGLFASAPILLLTFWVPGWWRRHNSLTGSREAWLIVLLSLALFLFASANEYGRLQFNSGVRYVVPAAPFLFLLVASVLLKMPSSLALVLGIATTYWSWCLAMYRDVEQGLGILEPVLHVTLEGVRLPWLVTLERLGYVSASGPLSVLALALGGIVVLAVWWLPIPSQRGGLRFWGMGARREHARGAKSVTPARH